MKNRKKLLSILGNVLLFTVLGLLAIGVLLTALGGRDRDGTVTVLGYQLRLVTTDSMAACDKTDVSEFRIGSIPARSLILVRTVPEDREEAEEWYAALRVGDVLTFRYLYTTQVTVTHRILSIEREEEGYCITLAGDNRADGEGLMTQIIHTADTNSPNFVLGRVVGKSYLAGLLLSLLRRPVGLVLLVILPSLIVIVLEILRIVSLLQGERRRRAQEEAAERERELEELRRKLARLEGAEENGKEGT